jgi:hypothetical protein
MPTSHDREPNHATCLRRGSTYAGIYWLVGWHSGMAGLLERLCHRVSAHAEVVVMTTAQTTARSIHITHSTVVIALAINLSPGTCEVVSLSQRQGFTAAT